MGVFAWIERKCGFPFFVCLQCLLNICKGELLSYYFDETCFNLPGRISWVVSVLLEKQILTDVNMKHLELVNLKSIRIYLWQIRVNEIMKYLIVCYK